MQSGADKKLIIFVLIGVAIVIGMLMTNPKNIEVEVDSLVISHNVDPSVLPSLDSVSKKIHLNAIESGISAGELTYGDQAVTLINGYPSAEDIALVAGLAEGSYQLDQHTGKSVMINNGDCLIVYTEAQAGMAPEIVDLFNTCN